MSADLITELCWLLAAYAALFGVIGLGCWYGLKQLPLEED